MGTIIKKINIWKKKDSPVRFGFVNNKPCPTNGDWMNAMLNMPRAMMAEHEAAMCVSEIRLRLFPEALGLNPYLLFRAWPDPVEKMPEIQVDRLVMVGGGKGLPDWMLAISRGGYAGLCIEQKTPKGLHRPEQLAMKQCLQHEKMAYTTTRSPRAFFDAVIQYMDGNFHIKKAPISEEYYAQNEPRWGDPQEAADDHV